jgi:hypothetical protein
METITKQEKNEMKQLCNNLNKIAKKLGFGSVTSYDKLYNTSINTFANKNASMWFFTISLNTFNECVGIEINTTYFKHNEQTKKINEVCDFDRPMSLNNVLSLLN